MDLFDCLAESHLNLREDVIVLRSQSAASGGRPRFLLLFFDVMMLLDPRLHRIVYAKDR
jgi:hypothetical protein